MSGSIVTAVVLVIGVLICAAGLYYLFQEKNDPESRKIYTIIAGVGLVVIIGTVVKILTAGF